MEDERELDEINEFMDGLPQFISEMVKNLTPELELLTGKKVTKLPSSSELDVIISNLRRLVAIQKQIEKLKEQELTPKAAAQMISLLNRMTRLLVPGIPRQVESVDYVIEAVHNMSNLPTLDTSPQELDYAKKHWGLHDFICRLVQSVDETNLDDFLQEAFTGRHLVSQFQKVLSQIPLPKELRNAEDKSSIRSIEKLKIGLRTVTEDWEGLINLPYGLILLKSGKSHIWGEIRKGSLWNKVNKVLSEPLLNPLAKLEWVTVRNALAHGHAFFDPTRNVIVFQDIRRQVSWGVDKARLEGMDIYLANRAMMYTWNFVKTESSRSFENTVSVLRQLARQG